MEGQRDDETGMNRLTADVDDVVAERKYSDCKNDYI